MATFHFRVLDAPVTLSGPEDLLVPIVHAYRRFLVTDGAVSDTHTVAIDADGPDVIRDGESVVPLIRGLSPTIQLYERFLNAVFDRVEACAVLHGAALLDRQGKAWLVAGPSGFGKTSLTLDLLTRGAGFLSDDYAPLDLADGTIQPYPRTVGLLPGGSAPRPERFVEAAADPALPRLLGKALVDVGAVLGDEVIGTEAAPIGGVVILDAHGGDGTLERSRVQFGVWPRGVEEATRALDEIPGVEVLGRQDLQDLTCWQVALRHRALPTTRFSALLERDFVAFSETRPDTEPDFASEPRLTGLKRREAALLLCREMQNRRARGRLMQSYRGDTTALFLDVAASLSGSPCWRLEVGRFDATADILERLIHGKLEGSSSEILR
jgi:hypothetical protein